MSSSSTPLDDLHCPDCGYALRGIEQSDRCPECGLVIDRTEAGVSRIPWSHRRRLGRVRAYWATVWLATFHPKRLAEELNRPVRFADSQSFRAVTVLLAAAGPIALAVFAMLRGEWLDGGNFLGPALYGSAGQPGVANLIVPWFAGARLYPVIPLCVLFFFVLMTGAGSYWFAPRSLSIVRQNRAIALSYYASAPLAFFPVLVTLLTLTAYGANIVGSDRSLAAKLILALEIADFVIVVVVFFAIVMTTSQLLSAITPGRRGRAVLADGAIFVSSGLLIPLTFVVLPWCVGFVALVIESLV